MPGRAGMHCLGSHCTIARQSPRCSSVFLACAQLYEPSCLFQLGELGRIKVIPRDGAMGSDGRGGVLTGSGDGAGDCGIMRDRLDARVEGIEGCEAQQPEMTGNVKGGVMANKGDEMDQHTPRREYFLCRVNRPTLERYRRQRLRWFLIDYLRNVSPYPIMSSRNAIRN